jgi:hypothetical protein
MELSVALDLLLAVLLSAVIVYAFLLNRRLAVIRNHREELQGLITGFAEATKRAEAGIKELKTASEAAGKGLTEPIERAAALRDELAYIIKHGDQLAERLSESVLAVRSATPPAKAAATSPSAAPSARPTEAPVSEPARARPAAVKTYADEDLGDDEPLVEGARSKAESDLLKALRSIR